MHLDFLEIGTSNFRTLIEESNDQNVGISVEPLSDYLNQLPSPKKVIKENVAISLDDSESEIQIFYVPEDVIKEKGLKNDLKGCNKINDYHPKHKELKIENLVKIQKVKQIPIGSLFEKYNIESINFLKIDTEGGDCDILLNLKNYLESKNKKEVFPKKIVFESNSLTPKKKLDFVLKNYSKYYNISEQTKHDTTLERKW